MGRLNHVLFLFAVFTLVSGEENIKTTVLETAGNQGMKNFGTEIKTYSQESTPETPGTGCIDEANCAHHQFLHFG